jgi:two-component sensor histidine kinase
VPTLADLVRDRTDLSVADAEWLHLLVGDWQLVSDLSFADLVLWLPEDNGSAWVAGAHVRPVTGAMAFFEDQVGIRVERGRRLQIDRAYDERRIVRERDPDWNDDDVPVREEAVPVVRDGNAIAVMTRHTNLAMARMPGRLELTYQSAADDLARMIAAGSFPIAGAPTGSRRGAPRVGDGFVRLDAEGVVDYASPNAVSAIHRIGHPGEVVGASLAEVVTPLIHGGDGVDESLALVVRGRAPWRAEIEANGATLSLRAIPIVHDGIRTAALVLLRDVSELRRRERELMTKDATIREIHHRVKNNLQTVAALLRLQARRLPEDAEGRGALEEAVRRVGAIALVHQTLSQGLDETVAFDDIAAQTLAMLIEVARRVEQVSITRTGSFGLLRAEDASPLALVLTELLTNAVEHGLRGGSGDVTVAAERELDADGRDVLRVQVGDDGEGMPAAFDPAQAGLGTQIVQALVRDLRGTIDLAPRPGGGTLVRLELHPRPLGDP